MPYRPTFQKSEFHKPSQHYEIDTHGSTILIAHIHKNASTVLKLLHRKENPKIIKAKKQNSKDYRLKIFICRDPLKRFIYIFLNKFVNNTNATVIKKTFYN